MFNTQIELCDSLINYINNLLTYLSVAGQLPGSFSPVSFLPVCTSVATSAFLQVFYGRLIGVVHRPGRAPCLQLFTGCLPVCYWFFICWWWYGGPVFISFLPVFHDSLLQFSSFSPSQLLHNMTVKNCRKTGKCII